MRPYSCDHCGNRLFFENVTCVACGHALGFVPAALDLSALEPSGNGLWRPLAKGASKGLYRTCANGEQHGVCNWMVPADSGDVFCLSCQLNRTIPDLSVQGHRQLWHRLEQAKRRLLYTFLSLRLPLDGPPENMAAGLRFNFLADPPGGQPVLTNHDGGLITLSIAEADDAERERRRANLNEPFRTLLGHFRHEAAHYCWDRLVRGTSWLWKFRALFGDETADYASALQRHYNQGPPPGWQDQFVTGYAASHPWEDWAETCAHYFHMTDTIETAAGFGLSLRPDHPDAPMTTVDARQAGRRRESFDALHGAWGPLTLALNSLNRGMGLPDLYPFVLSAVAIRKLRLVHDILTAEPAEFDGHATIR